MPNTEQMNIYFSQLKLAYAFNLYFAAKIQQFKSQNFRGRRGEDGGRVRRGDHLPPDRYIRNTSTRGTALLEHPLNAGRRPQTSQKARNSPRTWVGQKKKEKTETKEYGQDLHHWEGAVKEERFPHTRSPFAGGDCGWRRGEALEPRRRAQQQGCGGQSGDVPAQRMGADQHSPAGEACLLTRRDGRGLGAEARLPSDCRERTGVGGVNTA